MPHFSRRSCGCAPPSPPAPPASCLVFPPPRPLMLPVLLAAFWASGTCRPGRVCYPLSSAPVLLWARLLPQGRRRWGPLLALPGATGGMLRGISASWRCQGALKSGHQGALWIRPFRGPRIAPCLSTTSPLSGWARAGFGKQGAGVRAGLRWYTPKRPGVAGSKVTRDSGVLGGCRGVHLAPLGSGGRARGGADHRTAAIPLCENPLCGRRYGNIVWCNTNYKGMDATLCPAEGLARAVGATRGGQVTGSRWWRGRAGAGRAGEWLCSTVQW